MHHTTANNSGATSEPSTSEPSTSEPSTSEPSTSGAASNAATGGPRRVAGYRLALNLDGEWAHLRTHRRSLATARSWALPLSGMPAEIHDLEQLVHATHRRCGDRGNELLAELVRLAVHDELAGQVVLRRLLPGLLAEARRACGGASSVGGGDSADAADLAVAAAWIVMRRYDVDRRPRHIAPALISDAIYLAFRGPRRRLSLSDAVDPAQFDWRSAAESTHALVELAETLRLAAECRVHHEHLDLLRDLVRAESPTALAVERGVTPRTIRNHRDRAIARIRAAVAG